MPSLPLLYIIPQNIPPIQHKTTQTAINSYTFLPHNHYQITFSYSRGNSTLLRNRHFFLSFKRPISYSYFSFQHAEYQLFVLPCCVQNNGGERCISFAIIPLFNSFCLPFLHSLLTSDSPGTATTWSERSTDSSLSQRLFLKTDKDWVFFSLQISIS